MIMNNVIKIRRIRNNFAKLCKNTEVDKGTKSASLKKRSDDPS